MGPSSSLTAAPPLGRDDCREGPIHSPAAPMRIAYVTETWPPELNGVSLTVERTVRYLRSRGHIVELIRPRQPGEAALDASDELRTFGCVIPMYPDLRFGLARRGPLARRFEQSRPDLVHLATPGPLGWAALAAARSRGIVTSSDFRTNFHQYSRHYGLGFFAETILGLLRRFHNLTQLSFVPTRARRRRSFSWSAASLRRRTSSSACVRSSGRGASGRPRAWSSSATARRYPASRPPIGTCASSARNAAPSWRRTTLRPTSSCSRACPTPSATSSWRRSLRACPSSPSIAPPLPSTSSTGTAAGSSFPATR